MMQITGQSTLSVTVCLDLEGPGLQVLINDKPFCIILSELPADPDGGESLQLIGDVYEGTCGDLGNLIGTFTGTMTGEEGILEDEFTFVFDFTMTGADGILHSKSKFTGNLVQNTEITLENVESEYAYFESNGVRVNLRLIGLEPESGAITFVENEVSLICLPTFIFAIEAPVGGIVMQVNKLAVLIPYIALAGLITAVSTFYIIKKRKE
jgi:hypothetical protein